MTDTELLDMLAECDGCALISDDFGNWAVSDAGMQSIPDEPGVASDISTTFFIEAHEWRPSIREALAAIAEEEGGE